MTDSATMPQLGEYHAAGGMHRLNQRFPTGGLRLVPQRRGIDVTARPVGDRHALGNDHAGTGPLTVILGHQGIGDRIRMSRPASRHRRHDNPVGKAHRTVAERIKQHV